MRILGLLVAGMLAFVSTNVQAYESRRGGAGRCEVPGPHGQLRLVRVRSKQECRAVQQREAQRYGRQRQHSSVPSRSGVGHCQVPGPHGQLRLVRVRSKQECRAVQQREAQRYGRQRQSGQYRRQHRSAPLGAIIGGIVGAAIGHQFDR